MKGQRYKGLRTYPVQLCPFSEGEMRPEKWSDPAWICSCRPLSNGCPHAEGRRSHSHRVEMTQKPFSWGEHEQRCTEQPACSVRGPLCGMCDLISFVQQPTTSQTFATKHMECGGVGLCPWLTDLLSCPPSTLLTTVSHLLPTKSHAVSVNGSHGTQRPWGTGKWLLCTEIPKSDGFMKRGFGQMGMCTK